MPLQHGTAPGISHRKELARCRGCASSAEETYRRSLKRRAFTNSWHLCGSSQVEAGACENGIAHIAGFRRLAMRTEACLCGVPELRPPTVLALAPHPISWSTTVEDCKVTGTRPESSNMSPARTCNEPPKLSSRSSSSRSIDRTVDAHRTQEG
jgi:hypothetical protein